MGCDIHLHTEVKIDGVWHHYSNPSVPRNYTLFGLMAGARREELAIFKPKGLPSDMSVVTALDWERWKLDAHHESWLSAKEIHRLATAGAEAGIKDEFHQEGSRFWECSHFGYLFGNSWFGWTEYPDERPEGVEDIRFVFWFDN